MKKSAVYAVLVMLILVFMLALPVSAATGDYRYPLLSDHYNHHGFVKMKVGEVMELIPMMIEYDTERESYPTGGRTWASRDPEIVSVAANGDATAHKVGTAKITVTYTTNLAERVTQTVYLKVEAGATTAPPSYSLTINKGKAIDLKKLLFPGVEEGSFEWAVKEEFLAKLDKNGVLEASGAGSGRVTATHSDAAGNTTVKTVTLKVMAEHHGSQNKIKVTLSPGETVDVIGAVFPDETAVSLRYYSCRSDGETVAAIDESQRVTARSSGSCTVTIIASFRGEEELRQTVQVVVR